VLWLWNRRVWPSRLGDACQELPLPPRRIPRWKQLARNTSCSSFVAAFSPWSQPLDCLDDAHILYHITGHTPTLLPVRFLKMRDDSTFALYQQALHMPKIPLRCNRHTQCQQTSPRSSKMHRDDIGGSGRGCLEFCLWATATHSLESWNRWREIAPDPTRVTPYISLFLCSDPLAISS
jgi:hypothetical protein